MKPFRRLAPLAVLILAASALLSAVPGGASAAQAPAGQGTARPAAEHVEKAAALLAKGETDAAVLEYREALRLDPKDAQTHVQLASALKKKGDREAALEELRVAADLAPEDLTIRAAYEKLRRELAQAAKTGAAAPGGSALSQEGIPDPSALRRRTWTTDDVIGPGQPGGSSSPGGAGSGDIPLPPALRLPAQAKAALAGAASGESPPAGQTSQAPAGQGEGPAANPAREQQQSCYQFLRAGDAAKAMSTCRAAVDSAPEDAYAHFYYCQALLQNARASQAIGECRAAVNISPEDYYLRFSLGRTYLVAADSRSAKAELVKSLELNPDFADAHYALGRALISSTDGLPTVRMREAYDHYRRAWELRPRMLGLEKDYCELYSQLTKLKPIDPVPPPPFLCRPDGPGGSNP